MEKIKGLGWGSRILKYLLWAILIFLVIRGIGSIIKPSNGVSVSASIAKYKEESNKVDTTKNGASAFAQMFVKDYLTYKGDNSDYQARVSKYTKLENIAAFNDKSDVLSVNAYKVDLNGNNANVYVKAQVRLYVMVPSQQPNQQPEYKTNEKDYFLNVSVQTKDNNYVINKYPLFIARPALGEIEKESIPGKEVDADEKQKISVVVNDFIKTYCMGTDSELSYYLKNIKKGVLGYKVELTKIKNIEMKKDDKTYYLSVTFEVKDGNELFNQSLNIKMIKEDRYFITDF